MRPARRAQAPAAPLRERLLGLIRGLPDQTMVDRLVRGRAWIPAIGIMLVGIVFLQVEELKLGALNGRAVQQTAQLSAQNQALLASTGSLGDTARIEALAARYGYIMPAPSQTGFLDASGDHLAAAMANLRSPDPNLYLNAPSTMNGGIAGSPVQSQVATLVGAGAPIGTATTSGATGTASTGTPGATGTTGTTGTSTTGTGTPAGTTGTGASGTGTTGTGTTGTGTTGTGTTGTGTTGTGTTGTAASGTGTQGQTGTATPVPPAGQSGTSTGGSGLPGGTTGG